MEHDAIEGILTFIKRAENLKNTFRHSFTSTGRRESSAEHSWRLCLLVMICVGLSPGLNLERCLKLAVLHDLPEAVCGDTPAICLEAHGEKNLVEKEALADLVKSLPERMRDEIFGLWEEYAAASTDEAKFVKALDKLETLIQHNQGLNSPDFDYGFNLAYGANWTDLFEVSVAIRRMVDDETRNNISPDYAL